MESFNSTPCQYLSQTFLNIWKVYAGNNLKKHKTKYDYMLAINRLCEYTTNDFLSITEQQADEFFLYLAKDCKMTIKSLNSRLSCYRSIARFIYQDKEQLHLKDYTNPFDSIHVGSYSEFISPAAIPTIPELDLLLASVKDDAMSYLIFALALRCGLSASEICSLKVESFQIDSLNRMFLTLHKGKRERIVKIPDDVYALLNRYCDAQGYSSGPLFYNKKGKPMAYHALFDLVKSAMQNVNLSYTLQDLRNTSIAYMLKGGADNNTVANYVGVSERWMFRYKEVLPNLDTAPCDFQCFEIK